MLLHKCKQYSNTTFSTHHCKQRSDLTSSCIPLVVVNLLPSVTVIIIAGSRKKGFRP